MVWSDERPAPDLQSPFALCAIYLRFFREPECFTASVLPRTWEAQMRYADVDSCGATVWGDFFLSTARSSYRKMSLYAWSSGLHAQQPVVESIARAHTI